MSRATGAYMADLPIQTWAVPVELTERTVAIVHARTPEEAQELVDKFQEWVMDKELPDDEVYLAALGPCGK